MRNFFRNAHHTTRHQETQASRVGCINERGIENPAKRRHSYWEGKHPFNLPCKILLSVTSLLSVLLLLMN